MKVLGKDENDLSFKVGVFMGVFHFIISLMFILPLFFGSDGKWTMLFLFFFIPFDLPFSLLVILAYNIPREYIEYISFLKYPLELLLYFVFPVIIHGIIGPIWYFFIPILIANFLEKKKKRYR